MSTSFGGARYPSANAATYARTQRAQVYAAQQRARNAVMGDRAALAGLPGALSGKVRGYPKGESGRAPHTPVAGATQKAPNAAEVMRTLLAAKTADELPRAITPRVAITLSEKWNRERYPYNERLISMQQDIVALRAAGAKASDPRMRAMQRLVALNDEGTLLATRLELSVRSIGYPNPRQAIERQHYIEAQTRIAQLPADIKAAQAALVAARGETTKASSGDRTASGSRSASAKKAADEPATARGGLTQQEVERISQDIQHAADRARIATIQGIWNKPISAGDLRQLYHYTTDAQVATHLAKFPAADLRAGVRAMGIAPARTKAGMVDQLMGRTTNEQAPSTRATGSRGGSAKKAVGGQTTSTRTSGGRSGRAGAKRQSSTKATATRIPTHQPHEHPPLDIKSYQGRRYIRNLEGGRDNNHSSAYIRYMPVGEREARLGRASARITALDDQYRAARNAATQRWSFFGQGMAPWATKRLSGAGDRAAYTQAQHDVSAIGSRLAKLKMLSEREYQEATSRNTPGYNKP